MYKRGQTKAPEKSERIEENLKKITGGKKKWVRYDEGAALYSMGIHSFQKLAKDAKATYYSYPTFQTCCIEHKHNQSDSFHVQGYRPTLKSATELIMAHDSYQLSGRGGKASHGHKARRD